MSSGKHRNHVAQINIHVMPEDTAMLSLVKSAQSNNIPLSTMAEAALEFTWQHFPNEVKALAQQKHESRPVGPGWLKQLQENYAKAQEENVRLKQQLGLK